MKEETVWFDRRWKFIWIYQNIFCFSLIVDWNAPNTCLFDNQFFRCATSWEASDVSRSWQICRHPPWSRLPKWVIYLTLSAFLGCLLSSLLIYFLKLFLCSAFLFHIFFFFLILYFFFIHMPKAMWCDCFIIYVIFVFQWIVVRRSLFVLSSLRCGLWTSDLVFFMLWFWKEILKGDIPEP